MFVARCAGAAATAYELAVSLGLTEASWAAVSAVIVSQEELRETQSSLVGRVIGTLVGIVVTILVRQVTMIFTVSVGLQMGLAIAVCALIAQRFPLLRVAMWTCPILLLPSDPVVPITAIAVLRGGEVVLGTGVGWSFHWVEAYFLSEAAQNDRPLR
ncbi:FUSC family protein [Dyella halodurans]